MKKVYILFFALIITTLLFAQVPQKMSYQAVIRNSSNQLVTNQSVGIKISILQGTATGTPVYVETQTPTTNSNGLVSIEIGGGTVVSGEFSQIDWSSGIYFIKTETDPTGGTSYTITGTSQLLSVPYALYAKTSNNTDGLIGLINMLKTSLAGEGLIKDYENNVYNTVKIGTQIWMAENLKSTEYNDGTAIPLISDQTTWSNLTTPGYCWYNNDINTYGKIYGALYNWYAVNTGKLCPVGWHVPNNSEWLTLINYLGGLDLAGAKLKMTGTTYWNSPNSGATNESGFSAIPGGWRSDKFYSIGDKSSFISSEALTLVAAFTGKSGQTEHLIPE